MNNNEKERNIGKETRKDESPQKRVELHCHTNMSEMDGVSDVRDIINRAIRWGHRAVAITDHGVVQAFPDAYQAVPKDSDFKVIYGMEAYLVDDTVKSLDKNQIKELKPYHAVILVANERGRVNLYRLVSYAHLEYFNRVPLIPKSLLIKYREGLILGSADEEGELYQALLHGASDGELAKIIGFYDYLEIQPIGDKDLNQRIVKLGEQYDKPVAGTGDVHFLDPEDEVYRNILLANRDDRDDEHEAPLYFRTTEEMLDEFAYLGEEKAYEVVVTNTNLIADRIERIVPIRKDKCYPLIENADQTLTQVCCDRAHEIYGDPLPQIVRERLEKELHPIIKNGFSSLYMIARKLVLKSNEDGYLVGSRGCAGASFVAYLAGITEVNPLPPHYFCPGCQYSDFDSPEVRQYAGMAGCDLPDKICPKCGERMKKDGFDIPFETFLGFNGEKEPDFDLNFAGEYQNRAHKYTEEIFGEGHTFYGGTISIVSEETANEYATHYMEECGEDKNDNEIKHLAEGCVGVKKTTGRHPGGIIVLPEGEEICSFTPVQHPADEPNYSEAIATHFDYHFIDHSLLKLDLLSHDDPTMLHMLQDLTGVDPTTIPLDDPKVMSLFTGTEALDITPSEISNMPLGVLGIPGYDSDFMVQILQETQPSQFSDLIQVYGLSHGTGVWEDNAQTLLKDGKATIKKMICNRDDIMNYLVSMGLDYELSFSIMESVRRGRGLKPDWEKEMSAHGVPDWYIWSCKQIRYMFPRAHAAAYVMMAWRIAFYKVYYPAAFYAAYFSIRANGFDYSLMCMGEKCLRENMKAYWRWDSLSHKEMDTYKDMKVVLEMYSRGLNFAPIDLYRADPTRFQIVGENLLMPSLDSVEGIDSKTAELITTACKDRPFLSIEDFMCRTKASRDIAGKLLSLGILADLPGERRVELQCRTKLSEMDGAEDTRELIMQAHNRGCPAIAITDRGDVRAFPKAYECVQQFNKDDPFKVIYGMEGNLSDNLQSQTFYHIDILVKEQSGIRNLYQLVSLSSKESSEGIPRITKEELKKHREGLLLGSGCGRGELYQALINGNSYEEIAEIVEFYDYLEVLPIQNLLYILQQGASLHYNSKEEELQNINHKIVELGKRFKKPVVATGNVHYINPADGIAFQVIKEHNDCCYAKDMPPLYLRSTKEMLDEFAYLGETTAQEIVIDNPDSIADSVCKIKPIRTDRCRPNFTNAERILTEECYERAHAIYGSVLPVAVSERLEEELNSAKSNGYVCWYLFFQNFTKEEKKAGKYMDYGCSAIASFIDYLIGLTDQNPLNPHYYCPNCHFADFDSDEVKKYVRECGYDMPDRSCPICGRPLSKDGFGLSFETFFRGYGEIEEPDVYLRFSEESFTDFLKCMDDLLGQNHVFRTCSYNLINRDFARHLAKEYHDDKERNSDKEEYQHIITDRCNGIYKGKSMFDHIVVIPAEEDIYSFTPINYEKDEAGHDLPLTHFDLETMGKSLMVQMYHSDSNSHSSTSRMDQIDFPATEILLEDSEILSLFQNTDALGIQPEDIGGYPTGCLDISINAIDYPSMAKFLAYIKPQTFSELFKVYSMWVGGYNLRKKWKLIESGQRKLSDMSFTEDELMSNLLGYGVDRKTAFHIVRQVRYGETEGDKWREYKKKMKAKGVPEWYISSIEENKYPPEKAYVLIDLIQIYRMAYYKIHYPEEFYRDYFKAYPQEFPVDLALSEDKRQLLHYAKANYELGLDYGLVFSENKGIIIAQEMRARGIDLVEFAKSENLITDETEI